MLQSPSCSRGDTETFRNQPIDVISSWVCCGISSQLDVPQAPHLWQTPKPFQLCSRQIIKLHIYTTELSCQFLAPFILDSYIMSFSTWGSHSSPHRSRQSILFLLRTIISDLEMLICIPAVLHFVASGQSGQHDHPHSVPSPASLALQLTPPRISIHKCSQHIQ